MNNVVTAKEIAAWIGVSDRTVSDLAIRGFAKKLRRGQYDLKETVALYTAHLREVAAGRGDGRALDLVQERARLAREQADGQELKNRITRGDVLARGDVEREWSDILRKVRSGILACTSRIRSRLPHLTANDGDIIDRELRDALTALADDDDESDKGEGATGAASTAQA